VSKGSQASGASDPPAAVVIGPEPVIVHIV
jgi:hypothetical protein